jgi:DNA-binding transcriptional MocR family regulator
MSREELLEFQNQLKNAETQYKDMGLNLDMSRGKPAPNQLDLSMELISENNGGAGVTLADGTDARNYGVPYGIPELRAIFGEVLGMESSNIIIAGNSSLNVMFDTISQGITHGFGEGPWIKDGKIKFLCPAPGYDRHFAICEYFDIDMITIPMLDDGPDMDMIEKLVAEDKQIKGIWCVPMYSNPTGITYSDDVVKRFANLKPAAKDFRIFWDNSYCVHHLYNGEKDKLLNIYDEAKKNGNEDIVFIFTSTSKITFAGGGVSVTAASDNNIEMLKARMFYQTICKDKLNQLRHIKFLKDAENIDNHMKKHADIIRPKFETVIKVLTEKVGPYGVAKWTNPKGGYFISLDVMNNTAKRTVDLCAEMGVKLTPAGSTYPYKKDPDDKNIRIAPTFPSSEQLNLAAQVLSVAVLLSATEKLLEK